MSNDSEYDSGEEGIYWGRANVWLLVTLSVLVLASFLPSIDTTIDESVLAPLADLTTPVALILFWIASRAYYVAAMSFNPTAVIQAKRANEQIRLTATFFNNLAVAGVIGILLTKSIPDSGLSIIELLSGLGAAMNAHLTGRDLLYFLKDEQDKSYPT